LEKSILPFTLTIGFNRLIPFFSSDNDF